MPWTTPAEPPELDEAILKQNRERKQVRESVPAGWTDHHNLLRYGTQPANPLYGVCGHHRVCLMNQDGRWKHEYPFQPFCDEPPTTVHSGIF